MTKEDNRAKLIKTIMKSKRFYDGIHLQELYKLIKAHPDFDKYYGSSIKNNPEQYQKATIQALQHRAPGETAYLGFHDDFFKIRKSLWTYLENPNYQENINVQKDIKDKIKDIETNQKLYTTERSALVKVRINQSKFRKALLDEMKHLKIGSPIRRLNKDDVLIASHIVDYADCKDLWEKGNFYNGLILSPDVDKLFDRKYISFDENDGHLIMSKSNPIDQEILNKMYISKSIKLPINFLTKERKEFFKKRNNKYGFK